MDSRIFHGQITPQDVADFLLAEFNRTDYQAQKLGQGDKIAVQIATRERPMAGGDTALTVSIQTVEDGISIQLGNQAWLGVAASLGATALTALRNPWLLLTRLDDLAQDIENIQLTDQVWRVIESAARAANASFELSDRLRRIECEYCSSANPTGESNCIACGGPLGRAQPDTCKNCGFVLKTRETLCPNCGKRVE